VLCGKGRVDFKPRPGYPEASHYIGESTVPLEEFQDRAHTREAIAYLKNGRKDKPFFMWLNWNAPHPPYSIPAPYHGSVDRSRVNLPPADDPRTKPPYQSRLWETFDCAKISEAQWLELAATYLDMCRFVDDQVRDIFSTLEETGQRENTIVLLWSDHGDFAGEHRLPEKWDTSFYDCITRVPLILDIPGHAPARIGGLVESIDILPTVLALAGVEAPRGIQGLDLGPMIRGETAEMRTEVFCQGGQEEALLRNVNDPDGKTRPARAYWYKQKALYDEPRINARAKMIRDHRYKYCYHAGGFEEFYDLETDPHELVNLAVSSPADRDPIARYRQRLLERLIAVETVEPFQEGLDS
jgi:arylsulfatase A-like enzyme